MDESLEHPKKGMRIFTAEEGAEAHTHINNFPLLHQVIFDWLDEVLTQDEPTSEPGLVERTRR